MINIKKQIILISIFIVMFQSFSFGQGSEYTGTYVDSSPIVLDGINNQTISKLSINNPSGHCIKLSNCSNITIENCQLGPSKGEGVFLSNCKNITVVNCSMDHVESGVVADIGSGIKILHNEVRNVQGPMPRGQMVQFGNVSGNGNSISYNIGENILGQSFPEDEISLYKSDGTPDDPIQVVGNWIRGGGPSNSGGGIMTGDMGGSNVIVQDNILVNPGQYGITISSGAHIVIRNNKIFSDKEVTSNVGLSANNQYPSVATFGNTILNNQVNFKNKDGVLNNMWNSGNAGVITGWDTNVYDANLTSDVLPVIIIGRARMDFTLKIYPNPVYSQSILVTTATPNAEKLVIKDSKGEKVIDKSIDNSKTEIDTSMLTMGVYTVEVLKNNIVINTRKIIM